MSSEKRGREQGKRRGVQNALRALSDTALVREMREADEPRRAAAWAEFFERFRPELEDYAARVGVPTHERSTCVDEVLGEEALRLSERSTVPPALIGYLHRAVRHRWLRMKRNEATRQRIYRQAALDMDGSEPVIVALCSSSALRVSQGRVTESSSRASNPAVAHWVSLIRLQLTEDELKLLQWAGDMIPRRSMAEWLGADYDTTKRRVTRLLHRARKLAHARVQELSREEQAEVRRLLRRAGALPMAAAASSHSTLGEQSKGEDDHDAS